MSEPFHAGEIAIQERLGERSQAVLNGRMIWPAVPAAARAFVREQLAFGVGWQDASGRPWAAMIGGEAAGATCDADGTIVTIQTAAMTHLSGRVRESLRVAERLGLLFIDFTTRRRLRVNGTVGAAFASAVRVHVEQAFPNCPKYIQQREALASTAPAPRPAGASGIGMPDDLDAWLVHTDTVLVSTVGPGGSVDCSHRGGQPGFLRAQGGALVVPDYPGNSMFCTLGNLAHDPRAGLVLIDFAGGRQLHLSGDARLDLEGGGHPGERRCWQLRPQRWVVSPLPLAWAWRLVSTSPFNPPVERGACIPS